MLLRHEAILSHTLSVNTLPTKYPPPSAANYLETSRGKAKREFRQATDGILLIINELAPIRISVYWLQPKQCHRLCLQRCRLRYLLERRSI